MSYTNEELKTLGRWFMEAFLEVYPAVESNDPNRIRQALVRWFTESIDPQKTILNKRQRIFASLSDEETAAFRAVPIKVDPETNCRLWQGPVNKEGYGKFYRYAQGTQKGDWGNRGVSAHHLAYFLAHGPIPAKYFLYQRCQDHLCLNDEHLFVSAVRGWPHNSVPGIVPIVKPPVVIQTRAEHLAALMKDQEGS
jgi:hypothetical protein